MSNPVKKDDVEDVLSSIRRLVTASPQNTPDPISDPGPVEGGKLVLTQALRVNTDGTGAVDDPLSDTLERRIAELEAAVTAQRSDFEPDGSEPGDAETPRSIDHLAAARRMAAQFRADGRLDGGAGNRAQDGPPPVGDAPEPLTLTAALSVVGAESAETASDSDAEAGFFEEAPVVTLAESDSLDPQGAEAGPRLDLDDAALRSMIQDMVRQELKGELGTRISRSLRKLIRREIQRALSARDLD